jgi:hypothetical protein
MTAGVVVAWLLCVTAAYVYGQDVGAEDCWRALQTVERELAGPGEHPGNVFLRGETVVVRPPADLPDSARSWRVVDDLSQVVAQGSLAETKEDHVPAGTLGVGWYRLEYLDEAGERVDWTTAAVLAPLKATTPQNSPICIDSATAWFARDDQVKQQQFSRLAALAGVNWIRDRMRWREMQPSEREFAADTTYDTSASIQHRFGLKVLQVFHDTPPWAAGRRGRGRFPDDLRAVYDFGREMARRFKGRVQAWEPWNEANVTNFGAHTIDEICAYQKAAYLGFKAGDPELTVCWNVTTGKPTDRHTQGLLANETWPYFDTYNIHTYDWSHSYDDLWKPARMAACGKPIWITEADRGMKADDSSPHQDLAPRDELLKAQYVTQSYATSLYAGANRHFHFILGQYGEGETQFGLLRYDLTPRPGYVALAALGRFLAGARCLGRVVHDNPLVHIYAFNSHPDGHEKLVLIAWIETTADWPGRGTAVLDWSLPGKLSIESYVEACYDYLGRDLSADRGVGLSSKPLYFVADLAATQHLDLRQTDVSSGPPVEDVRSCHVVLQRRMPRGNGTRIEEIPWAWEFEHPIPLNKPTSMPVFIYNFADHEVQGTVEIEELPSGIVASQQTWEVSLPPMGRQELPAEFSIEGPQPTYSATRWVKMRGAFGADGAPVLAFQLWADSSD